MSETTAPPAAWPLARACPMLPPPALAEFREGPPRTVSLRGGQSAWLITRHEDVRRALAEPGLSVDDQHPNFPNRLLFPVPPRAVSFWRMDEPEHGAHRRMIAPEFTAYRTQEMRPAIMAAAEELIDALEAGEKPADMHAGFTLALPCIVIARIFGVPDEDMKEFKKNTGALLNQGEPQAAFDAFVATTRYLDQLATAREREPRDDLLSRLATRYVRTGELSHDDFVAMVRLMLVAGHETTANQLALSILTLLDRPDVLAELREDPRLLTPVTDELLRYWSIAQDNVVRVAAEDLDIGGAAIAAGDAVLLSIPAADHDERAFPHPADFDIHRDNTRHLAFGHGPHFCPGGPLARTELEITIETVFRRLPGLRLAVDRDRLPFRTDSLVHGLSALPVTW
ncbi:cytochrome P450 [Streptantibioticus silvisoli]|uniref:Cytochrome P450 n=1 Tax=Streptantibioticus silvisoli TaxID=2705255 RepID=A0ABT6W6J3_9ACTN|nr:cytochrome P450 [Streptantibioticus silvisoli]MDI5966368.1 cytochrome P450 [Streptantibioticus silvisoli]